MCCSRPVVGIGLELCGWDSYIFLVNFLVVPVVMQ